MGLYGTYLRELLAPLGVYDLRPGTLNEAELYALGRQLDRVHQHLELAEREALTATAEDEGLERWEALFASRPAAATTEDRRAAILALTQIDGDDLTPAGIDRALRGCGIPARAVELDAERVQVEFPGVVGVPEAFDTIRAIILEILPCHLLVEFYFRYLTWQECQGAELTWAWVESEGHTWDSFQRLIFDEW